MTASLRTPKRSDLLDPDRQREFRAVVRAAQHVWLTVGFIFVWLHFSYVKPLFRHQDWQLYALYFLAVAGIAGRYLTGIRHGHERWHRVVFDALSILFIGLGVNLTGGIHSDLWLVYFIFVIAETLAASARGFLITDSAAVVSYVIATWPREVNQVYFELLVTRIFFMVLVASIARTIAWDERLRQADVSALREALSVSEERRSLARDLHDGIGHTLTRVILSLEVARRQAVREPQAAAESIAQQANALRGAMEEMRQIVATLRTETAAFDVRHAVRTMAAQLAESGSLEVEARLPEAALPLSPPAQYQLTRVIQEALTNCMKHAGVQRARVEVELVESPVGPPRVQVTVSDEGSGFDPEHQRAECHGLRGMRERLVPYGGRVTIDSAPGAGTRVTAELPGEVDDWLGEV
jgi:signal transduction histidine kinase